MPLCIHQHFSRSNIDDIEISQHVLRFLELAVGVMLLRIGWQTFTESRKKPEATRHRIRLLTLGSK